MSIYAVYSKSLWTQTELLIIDWLIQLVMVVVFILISPRTHQNQHMVRSHT